MRKDMAGIVMTIENASVADIHGQKFIEAHGVLRWLKEIKRHIDAGAQRCPITALTDFIEEEVLKP